MTEKIFNGKEYAEIYCVRYFCDKHKRILRAHLYKGGSETELKGALIWFDETPQKFTSTDINRLNKLLDIPELNGVPMDFLRQLY